MTQEQAEVKLLINDQAAKKTMSSLEEKAENLKKKLGDAIKIGNENEIKKINKELSQTYRTLDGVRTKAKNIEAAMVRLNEASPKELQRTIKYINGLLANGEVKRGSEDWKYYINRLKEAKAELKKVKAEMALSDDRGLFSKVKDGFNEWAGAATAAVAALTGLVLSGKSAVQAYADMEAEEANVRKFTGMTRDEVASLNAEFKKMDTRTARENLNKLAQEGGRLGKQTVEDVLGYVKAADKINVALDDLGEGATLTLSKLTGIFGIEDKYGTERSLLKVGSVVNELSQNCSASAPYLTEFTSRLGGIAAQSKISIDKTMAYAAVLDTQNLAVEASATAVGQLITKIYKEPAKFAEKTGLEVKKFTDMVKTDMNGALIMLFEHLNKFGGMETLATVFDDLGTDGARAIPVLTALAGHVEELKAQQVAANDAFREGISVTAEFNVQNNTVQARIDKAKKKFNELAVSLGEKLLPVMQHCISGSSMMLRVLTVITDFVVEHKKEILTLTATLVAYNLVLKAHAIQLGLVTLRTKAWIALGPHLKSLWAVARLVLVGMLNSIQYLTNGLEVNIAMQQRWRNTMSMISKSTWVGIILSLAAAFYLWTTRTKDLVSAQKELAKIREKGLTDSAEEVNRLRLLEKAANDETLSLNERKRAIQELNDIVPDYNGSLDETTGLYNANKKALDDYIDSLIKLYEIEGAKESLAGLGKERAELETERRLHENQLKREKEFYSAPQQRSDRPVTTQGAVVPAGILSRIGASGRIKALENDLDKIDKKLKNISEREQAIIGVYGADALMPAKTPEFRGREQSFNKIDLPESDEDRKKREKEERERQRKAKEALKADLDAAKYARDKAEAENILSYSTGLKNYNDYVAEKERIERDYADKIVGIHEQHNTIDIAAYGQSLLKREELKKQSLDRQAKLSIKQLEDKHAVDEREAIDDFYDPNGPLFNNQKALNQRLFELDVNLMLDKAKLYEEGSKEREQIERQVNDLIAKDQLDKQKETATAYIAFEKEYRASAGSQREKLELDVLKDLLDKKLISEEEYQVAVAKIKQKYRDEDREKLRETASEYADVVLNLYDSFSKFFDNLGQKGSSFWDNLADAAEAAFAFMGSALSQYSAYSDASRDLEIAKIEKRYDAEIEAAGNNSKKTAALEKKKEAEIAKVKKQYNDRAMKIEIAQAFAQTAAAAIAAYASAAAIPATGWIMAPIAAALATAAGMAQIATIKKQHEAEAAGYYSGGFTTKDPDNRREVGVVHANEFVANHKAVANPALSPVLRLIDHAQRTNTVGSLSADDVDIALGRRPGVSARGGSDSSGDNSAAAIAYAAFAESNAATREAVDRLTAILADGLKTEMIMDGENGFHKKYEHYKRLISNPKR